MAMNALSKEIAMLKCNDTGERYVRESARNSLSTSIITMTSIRKVLLDIVQPEGVDSETRAVLYKTYHLKSEGIQCWALNYKIQASPLHTKAVYSTLLYDHHQPLMSTWKLGSIGRQSSPPKKEKKKKLLLRLLLQIYTFVVYTVLCV